MKLEKAIMLLEYNQNSPIVVVLLATRSSTSMRQALTLFTKKFQTEFLTKDLDLSESMQFQPATKFIFEFFDFLPDTVIAGLEAKKDEK